MLKNYLLLAFKVLQRHKFYTFVSLFGISITLMVLIVLTSLIENFLHPAGPERNSEHMLVAGMIALVQEKDGSAKNRSTGPLGYRFVDKVLQMRTPETIAVFSGSPGGILGSQEIIGFRDGIKISSYHKRTDANYWNILHFDFLEGRPISEAEHQQGAYVAVISETTRGRYFSDEGAVGKPLVLDGEPYQVIGVVADVSPLQTFAVADIWTPIFATPSTQFRYEDRGNFLVLMQGNNRDDLQRIREEYQVVVQNYQASTPAIWPPGPVTVYSHALSKPEYYTRLIDNIAGNRQALIEPENNAGSLLLVMLGAFVLAFMLLPVINMVNINLSRIMDRASEIGVRKSFGASSMHLVWQFVLENLVITILGGLLGLLLAKGALYWAAEAGLFSGVDIQFNLMVFALGTFYILLFGLLSAVYPAWRMSRMDPVRALKGALS